MQMAATITSRRQLPSLTVITSSPESSRTFQHSRSSELAESEDDFGIAEDAKLLDELRLVSSASSGSPGSEEHHVRKLVYQIIVSVLLVVVLLLSLSLAYLMGASTTEHAAHAIKGGDAASKAVVIASYREQNVTWINDLSSE